MIDAVTSFLKSLNWGSVPDWFAAIGTVAAVIAALYLAGKGTRDTRLKDQRKQAESISVWRLVDYADKTRTVVVTNPSLNDIYDVAISIGVGSGAGVPYQTGNENQVFILGLPNGTFEIPAPPEPKKGMHVELAVSISFRDTHGVFWRRDATGTLLQTKKQVPYADLDVALPIDKFSSFAKTK